MHVSTAPVLVRHMNAMCWFGAQPVWMSEHQDEKADTCSQGLLLLSALPAMRGGVGKIEAVGGTALPAVTAT